MIIRCFVALADALNLGGDPTQIPMATKIIFRRAWFEASTVAIAEVRMKLDRTGDEQPRKMPGPERTARLKAQQARLAGIKIEGNLKPSHAILDLLWQIKEEDALKYVSPEVCTSRSQESFGVKKESFVKTDSEGKLQSVLKEEELHADMTTEYRIKLAMTRRSLAFDNVGICSFAIMEEYQDYLYALVMRQSIPTHFPISVHQILQADKQLWAVMMELTAEGLAADATGKLPIEKKFALAKADPVYTAILQPLPRPTSGNAYDKTIKAFSEPPGPYQGGKGGKGGGKGGKGGKSGKGGKGGTGGKGGKGAGKGAKSLPEELKGLRQVTRTGKSFCWNFNLAAGCDEGNWCHKGLHLCMKCSATDHGFHSCPRKGGA